MTKTMHLGGFAAERGEVVRQGNPNLYGIKPAAGPIPIGPAPPNIKQVLAVFDSRPIGSYDFVLSDTFDPYGGDAFAEVVTAPGYITIVRRIEVEAAGGAVLLAENQEWNFYANGVAATAWSYAAGRTLSSWGVDTFFVIPPNTPIRLLPVFGYTGITSNVPTIVRFIGNLLLDTNEPPSEQVGTLPPAVHLLDDSVSPGV